LNFVLKAEDIGETACKVIPVWNAFIPCDALAALFVEAGPVVWVAADSGIII
jgi:hypothetical protein